MTAITVPPSSGAPRTVADSDRRSVRTHPHLAPRQVSVRRDDGVVHHHSESDDQGAERDPLQVDPHQGHEDEGRGEREDQREGDHHPHAPPHEQGHDDDDDDERLDEGVEEPVDGFADDLGLPVDLVDLDADRQVNSELVEACFNRRADINDVDAGLVCDRDANRRLAVEAHQLGRGIGIAWPDRADIAYPDQLGGGLERVRPDREIADVLRAKRTRPWARS